MLVQVSTSLHLHVVGYTAMVLGKTFQLNLRMAVSSYCTKEKCLAFITVWLILNRLYSLKICLKCSDGQIQIANGI